jgi:hypothetical protein
MIRVDDLQTLPQQLAAKTSPPTPVSTPNHGRYQCG